MRTSIVAVTNTGRVKSLPITRNIDLPLTLISRFDLLYLDLDQVDEGRHDQKLARQVVGLHLEDAHAKHLLSCKFNGTVKLIYYHSLCRNFQSISEKDLSLSIYVVDFSMPFKVKSWKFDDVTNTSKSCLSNLLLDYILTCASS